MTTKNIDSKLKRRKTKSMAMADESLNRHGFDTSRAYLPIDEYPPHQAHEKTLAPGDLVTRLRYKNGSLEIDFEQGIVIDAHWARHESSVRFSKKKGEWVVKYEYIPEAIVMWGDGLTSPVPMNLLAKLNE